MPSCVTWVCSEPEDVETALRVEGYVSLLITGRGRFRARLTQISLNASRLLAAEEHQPRIAFAEIPSDVVCMSFQIGDGGAPIFSGIAVRAGEIVTLGPGELVHVRTDGASHWGAVSISVEVLVRYGVALTGTAFAVPQGIQRCRPRPADGRRLRSLHAAAIRMAAKHPQALIDPTATHGLEQQLLHAVVECLSRGSAEDETRAGRRNRSVMGGVERLVQNGSGGRSSMPEIRAALGISERLLRRLCAEYLWMSPTAYDRLRRMSAARRALRLSDPAVDRVSAVARNNGFRDLGRFAVNYRATFGEAPSATLRRHQEPLIVALT
jgi:AraC-like DNA-binding protein